MKGLIRIGRLMEILVVLLIVFGLVSISQTSVAWSAEKYVTLLDLSDYSGPIASMMIPVDKGMKDYFKEVNAKGGVDGVRINFVGIDTRYNTARAVSAYRRYRRGVNLLAVNLSSTPHGKALSPAMRKDKVLGLYPADGSVQGENLPGITWGATYQDSFAAVIDWIIMDWKKKGKKNKPIIGYITWDNAYGRESLKGGKEYADKMPVKLLAPEFFPVGSLDHTVYLQRLAKHGAKYIIVGGVDPAPTNIIRDAHRMGLTKEIQFLNSSFWGPVKNTGVKLHPEELEGTVMASFNLIGEDAVKHSASKLWVKYEKQPLSEMTGGYFIGISLARDFEAGLKIAIDNVGYKGLNGTTLLEAYQQMTGSNHRGGVTPTCSYSPTNRRGAMQVKFYQIKGGKILPISDWVKVPDAVSLHNFK